MEAAVISGKGGTGKSSVAAAFATIAKNAVLADCDVDAANQYLLFNPEEGTEEVYIAGQKAVIDPQLCNNCGICIEHCAFDAISENDSRTIVSEIMCDGCHLCQRVCPHQAIRMVDNDQSRLHYGAFRFGHMVYGRLAPGEENSGKLVNLVREKAKMLAKENGYSQIILDGPPGIGCPVISTVTGVDKAVIVTEPTISGLHDLKRVLDTALHFGVYIMVIINKFDLNQSMTEEIVKYCRSLNVPVVARLPFDKEVTVAMINCKSIVEWAPDNIISKSLRSVWVNYINTGS